MSLLINIIPLIIVVVLLFLKKHMLVAGLAGGVAAVIIGGMNLGDVSSMFVGGISNMLGITVPILTQLPLPWYPKRDPSKPLLNSQEEALKARSQSLAD